MDSRGRKRQGRGIYPSTDRGACAPSFFLFLSSSSSPCVGRFRANMGRTYSELVARCESKIAEISTGVRPALKLSYKKMKEGLSEAKTSNVDNAFFNLFCGFLLYMQTVKRPEYKKLQVHTEKNSGKRWKEGRPTFAMVLSLVLILCLVSPFFFTFLELQKNDDSRRDCEGIVHQATATLEELKQRLKDMYVSPQSFSLCCSFFLLYGGHLVARSVACLCACCTLIKTGQREGLVFRIAGLNAPPVSRSLPLHTFSEAEEKARAEAEAEAARSLSTTPCSSEDIDESNFSSLLPEAPSTPMPGEDSSTSAARRSSTAGDGTDTNSDDLLRRLEMLKGGRGSASQQPPPVASIPLSPALIDGDALSAAFEQVAPPPAQLQPATVEVGDANLLISLDDSTPVAPAFPPPVHTAPLSADQGRSSTVLPAGFQLMKPAELHDRWTSLIILDLRPKSDFATSRIQPITGEELALVNVPLEDLKPGADVNLVSRLLSRRDKEYFLCRASYGGLAILVADSTDIRFDDGAPLRSLIVSQGLGAFPSSRTFLSAQLCPKQIFFMQDALTKYNNGEPLPDQLYIVEGGFAAFYRAFGAFCSGKPPQSKPTQVSQGGKSADRGSQAAAGGGGGFAPAGGQEDDLPELPELLSVEEEEAQIREAAEKSHRIEAEARRRRQQHLEAQAESKRRQEMAQAAARRQLEAEKKTRLAQEARQQAEGERQEELRQAEARAREEQEQERRRAEEANRARDIALAKEETERKAAERSAARENEMREYQQQLELRLATQAKARKEEELRRVQAEYKAQRNAERLAELEAETRVLTTERDNAAQRAEAATAAAAAAAARAAARTPAPHKLSASMRSAHGSTSALTPATAHQGASRPGQVHMQQPQLLREAPLDRPKRAPPRAPTATAPVQPPTRPSTMPPPNNGTSSSRHVNPAPPPSSHTPQPPRVSNHQKPQPPVFNRASKPAHAQVGRLTPQWNAVRQAMLQPAHSMHACETGLRNLGNTCFMNCILQALLNTTPLALHFVQNRYIDELNRQNPMGCRGELAEEFAELIRAMSRKQYRHISPRLFKELLSGHAPQFAGTQQQDAQVGLRRRGKKLHGWKSGLLVRVFLLFFLLT